MKVKNDSAWELQNTVLYIGCITLTMTTATFIIMQNF